MTSRILFFVLSIASIATVASSQVHFGKEERRIITLADERRAADTIASYLTSPNTRVAWRAAIGLANIGDTTTREVLRHAYENEKRDSVRDAEAFALGMLGPNDAVYRSIAAFGLPTHHSIIALARTVPSLRINDVLDLMSKKYANKAISDKDYTEGLMRLALRKLSTPKMFAAAEGLTASPDAEARWRAAYVFARVGDSADLSHRTARLKELTTDLGSASVRMFAASALGRLHDAEAESLLVRAFRGEQDWRVRINILNALAKRPTIDSDLFAVIRTATSEALPENPNAVLVGFAAQDALGSFITSGRLTPADSIIVRDYLDAFNGFDGRNAEIADRVKARASYSAALLRTPSLTQAERNFIESSDIVVRSLALEAAGVGPMDTNMFINLLASMPRVPAEQEVPTLIAMDTIWQRAKRDTAFRGALERSHVANVYRTTLIRVTGVVLDPVVASLALQQMQDSTIINDTAFRGEASRYLLNYVKGFVSHQFRDLLLPAVGAEAWLKDQSPAMIAALKTAYDTARVWHDSELMDSVKSALKAIGQPTDKLLAAIPIKSKIDWDYLERIPRKMLIGLEHGSIQLHLRTFEAPLTVLNMARLAERGYFAGQKFHRVVPNFVVQSGDPTGTGFGGPEYSIRTEIAPIEYDKEGVTGMASSGKDTEGSQWFITECPTPHLDGHYTIWADLIGGMEDMMKIQQGDRVGSMFPMP